MSRLSLDAAFELSDLIVDYDPDPLERRDVTLDTALSQSHRELQRLRAAARVRAPRRAQRRK